MQCSFDMVTWNYFGEVIHSGFGIETITLVPSDDHVYFRIVSTDIPTYDAAADDFNGDGISNDDSINQGIDPVTPPPGTTPPGQMQGLVAGHVYTLKVVQIGGDDAGTRMHLLDRNYGFLPNPAEPNSIFPMKITSSGSAAETTITFESVNPVQHDTPIDLIFYKETPDPDATSDLIPSLEKLETLIIPKGDSSITSTKTFTGVDINPPPIWKVAPFVVRGIDQTQDPGTIGTWDSGVDKTSRRAGENDLGSKTDTWIMAPGDGPPNQVEIETNAPFHVYLACNVGVIAPTLLQDSTSTVSFSAIADPTTNDQRNSRKSRPHQTRHPRLSSRKRNLPLRTIENRQTPHRHRQRLSDYFLSPRPHPSPT